MSLLDPGETEEYGEHQCAPTDPEVMRGYLLPTGRVEVSVGIFSGSTSLECQGVVSECG